MARPRNKGRAELSSEETVIAIQRMMNAAQAHQRASVLCIDKTDGKPSNIDCSYYMVVSFELVLLSVEQSLRLLLLLHYSIVRSDHSSRVLYGAVQAAQRESGDRIGIRQDIVDKMNALGQPKVVTPFSEKELLTCLKKHDSSYSTFRYFQLDSQARSNPQLKFLPAMFRSSIVWHWPLST